MLDFLLNITGVSQVCVCIIELLRTSKIYNHQFSNTFCKHLLLYQTCQHKDTCTQHLKSKTSGGVNYGLNSLKTTPDKQMRKFVEHFKVQEPKFNDIQLKGRVKGVKEVKNDKPCLKVKIASKCCNKISMSEYVLCWNVDFSLFQETFFKAVFERLQMSCQPPTEFPYYFSTVGSVDVCAHCTLPAENLQRC